jgi:hypothetical protein
MAGNIRTSSCDCATLPSDCFETPTRPERRCSCASIIPTFLEGCYYCCGPAVFCVSPCEWKLLMEERRRDTVFRFIFPIDRFTAGWRSKKYTRTMKTDSFFFFFLSRLHIKRNGKTVGQTLGKHDLTRQRRHKSTSAWGDKQTLVPMQARVFQERHRCDIAEAQSVAVINV